MAVTPLLDEDSATHWSYLASLGLVEPLPIDYPESDGQPMGETEWHVLASLLLFGALRMHFTEADVYFACDMFLYYDEGYPKEKVAPDIMAIKGVEKRLRGTFKVWEERQSPCFVLEVTSRSSRIDDMVKKRALYAMLGVREYFVFDPLGEFLRPPLVRFLLAENGEYTREDGTEFESAELGLLFRAEETRLHAYDLQTGMKLLDPVEQGLALREAERDKAQAERDKAQAEQAQLRESEARQNAEAEVKRLQEELERLRQQR